MGTWDCTPKSRWGEAVSRLKHQTPQHRRGAEGFVLRKGMVVARSVSRGRGEVLPSALTDALRAAATCRCRYYLASHGSTTQTIIYPTIGAIPITTTIPRWLDLTLFESIDTATLANSVPHATALKTLTQVLSATPRRNRLLQIVNRTASHLGEPSPPCLHSGPFRFSKPIHVWSRWRSFSGPLDEPTTIGHMALRDHIREPDQGTMASRASAHCPTYEPLQSWRKPQHA
jgi:hypothetical protein